MNLRAILPIAFAAQCAVAPAQAQQIAAGVTCADVRKLTAVERWYWRKRLGLTDDQVRAIRKQCGVK